LKILDHLPFSATERTVDVAGRYVTVKPLYIVVYVSLAIRDEIRGPLPVMLDPGHNHNFSISKDQLQSLLNVDGDTLPASGRARLRGEEVVLRKVDVLLHRNSKRKPAINPNNPVSLDIHNDRGIAVHQNPLSVLPVLGIRSFARNKLKLVIDYEKLDVSLTT
jgi:hypothetical protein